MLLPSFRNCGYKFISFDYQHVKKGTNGGVTKTGILAAAAAGSFIGLSFALLSFSTTRCESSTVFKQLLVLPIATFARLCGSLFDSLLGATLQTKWILFCSSQGKFTYTTYKEYSSQLA